MASRHMNRYPTSLIIREMHLTPVRMAVNKYQQVLERMGTLTLLVGLQTGAATVEGSMEIPQKIKNGSAF